MAKTRREMSAIDKAWHERVAGMVKAEMARRNVSYRELEERLRAMGVEDNEKNLSTKISRGGIGAPFFFQVMRAMGCRTIRLEDD
jgi:3-mercaptopyruvate sulfurtransferase SseA